mmetsp:Transcript_2790/g.9012  ORF Transcript_2790/g.9012 Transcript_2790/m.9012 type:complete len:260 (-) Transcript_2790:649-1428(-)
MVHVLQRCSSSPDGMVTRAATFRSLHRWHTLGVSSERGARPLPVLPVRSTRRRKVASPIPIAMDASPKSAFITSFAASSAAASSRSVSSVARWTAECAAASPPISRARCSRPDLSSNCRRRMRAVYASRTARRASFSSISRSARCFITDSLVPCWTTMRSSISEADALTSASRLASAAECCIRSSSACRSFIDATSAPTSAYKDSSSLKRTRFFDVKSVSCRSKRRIVSACPWYTRRIADCWSASSSASACRKWSMRIP